MTLNEIKDQVDALALKINAPVDLLPTYGYSRDFAYPHIEVTNDSRLHFIIVERGKEQNRKTTKDLNELLYWIFDGITFSMASDHELKNRIESQDSRRILFGRQEELLAPLKKNWGVIHRAEHEAILKNYPFEDHASLRAKSSGQLDDEAIRKDIDRLTSKTPGALLK